MNTTTVNPDASNHTTTIGSQQPRREPPHRPGRSRCAAPSGDRMLAGVAAGIARYLGVDVTVVRIVLAVLAVIGGAGVPIYLAGWLLIPEEGAEQSIASGFIQSMQSRSR